MDNPTITQEQLKLAVKAVLKEDPEFLKQLIREVLAEEHAKLDQKESGILSEKRNAILEQIMEEDAELLKDLAK